ncbi:MAG TPA: sigma-54 dependent transcriptional regulator, partial [Usitatibacter sp.]|nr:sigma-54 dependent transcriptional regulator [Usitatibacter sp.]
MAQALDRIEGVERVPLPLSGVASIQGRIDAVIVVAGPDSVGAAIGRLAQARARFPESAMLAVGDRLKIAQLHALIDSGIHDFLSYPFAEAELTARLCRVVVTMRDGGSWKRPDRASARLPDFIGTNPGFIQQIERLRAIAGCDAGVLILGETGTGKEVCAQAVHYLSSRASKPCVALNCGAIPLDLVESELFGHTKGAYTTAHAERTGLAREAEGGTLFLDDIDCLPLAAQAKLLRFLQEGEYRPVGSSAVHRANVRVIAASNRELAGMAARGEFRQDLFFRLNVLTVSMPPLRERRDDIPQLAGHFVRKFAARHQRPIVDLSAAALARLVAYDWPGNVRELRNVIERAVLLSRSAVIAAADLELPSECGQACDDSFRAAKERVVASFERSFIERLLAAHGGNVTRAALAAGKNRRAF